MSHFYPFQLQTALRFFASGCLFTNDGDLHGISKASVSRIVTKVTYYLAGLEERYICFPTSV